MTKILFKNASIATSNEVFVGSVLVEDEKIAHIYSKENMPKDLKDVEIKDLTGKYLLPGGVDVHTHFDLDMGFTRASDDFYTGSVAAAFGGTTTIIDHIASGPEGCNLTYAPNFYRQNLAVPCIVDYGLHGVIQHVNNEVINDMGKLPQEGISSIKIYLTYGEKLDDHEILQVLERAKQLGLMVCVHCENDAAITALRQKYIQNGNTQARFHPLSRPSQVEAEAVFRVLMLAQLVGEVNIYIVHLSSGLGLNAARLAQNSGQKNIFLETCPQYLFLNSSLYNDDKEGLKYILSPPLRSEMDVSQLWDAMRTGSFDTIATDHCPFFFDSQKQLGAKDFTKCPNGAPGVELRMPLIFSKAMQGVISLPQMVQMCCTRPAQLFGLGHTKGNIQVGMDADFAIFNPSEVWKVTKTALHENVDYSPYEGIEIIGRPAITVSRGEIITENGILKAEKGRGKYLHREMPLI